jgi:glycerate dehydrogenase
MSGVWRINADAAMMPSSAPISPAMQHIVFLDRATLVADLRAPSFPHTWTDHATTLIEQAAERLRSATIAVVNKVAITRDLLSRSPNLKLVAVAATGVNNVDLEACRAQGVAVCNIRDYATHTVPEHVFMLLLALRRNLLAWRRSLAQGAWQRADRFCLFDHEMHDLHGSTLGLIGHGSIGEGVAQLAHAFGMRVLIAERRDATSIRPGRMAFDEVLRQSDAISLHTPLTKATRNLIGAREFGLMPRHAVLINTARGGVVDEVALRDALRRGEIAGAATDVLVIEPPRQGNPLLDLDLPNLIVTPHVAWSSREAMQSLADQLIENIENFVAGTPRNLVIQPRPCDTLSQR